MTDAEVEYPQTLDYHQIVRLVPYRSPWLLLDRVISWDKKRIVVQKAISGAEKAGKKAILLRVKSGDSVRFLALPLGK